MVGEAFAGLSALKTAFDLAKGLKDINDATIRNGAIIELQEKILAAREQQSALLDRVGALEAEVARFETWDTEKQRYELKDIGDGAVAYMLKANARGAEPPHWLCPTCYSDGKKAFYQPTGAFVLRRSVYECQECQGKISIGGAPGWLDQVRPDNPRASGSTKRPGEACPKCGETEFRIERSEPNPTFGDLGAVDRYMKCDSCGFTETRMITPK
jgi:hypothetical protein